MRPPTSRPPIMPPMPPQRDGAGCGEAGDGAAGRAGDIGEGEDGEERPRAPRLPPDEPPPARAQASAVHNTGISTITSTARIALSRRIGPPAQIVSLKAASRPHRNRSATP